MRRATRLYERAAPPIALRPLWHVGDGLSLFAGPLGRNALHSHSIAVFLAGLYAPFRLRIDRGDWLGCRTAVIPAGVAYEFDLEGGSLGVVYLEPSVARADALVPLARNAHEVNRALVGSSGELAVLRELYETQASGQSIDVALQDLVGFGKCRARGELDQRIARIIEDLRTHYHHPIAVAELARPVGLSASRLQHLFAREVGVPLRRYRTWQRLRAAICAAATGATYTEAAHLAGFYDQSHFARDFRRTFGAPASRGLPRLSE
jgi:AraC-like DNA-binding protein